MLLDSIFLILGFFLLVKGADVMVEGSSSLAKKFGVSTFFIGLTVVAFGTSAPEFVVSAIASARGSSGIALGNIIGSNISNTLLILGVSAVVAPLVVKRTTIRKEIPFSLLSVAAAGILVNDFLIDHNSYNLLTRIDGLILILFFSIFIVYTFGISREKESLIEKAVGDIQDKPKEYQVFTSTLMIAAGFMGLALGGKLIVDSAMNFAVDFGVSEALIGLTIVAIGTSLPELAASAVAARKGKTDMAVGNVVGSNIFNMLWVLGASAIIRPIGFDTVLNFDFMLLFFITILVLFLIYLGKKNILAKREGAVLLVLYVFYIVFLVIRG